MLDDFDIALLNAVQADDGRTADQLAADVALSPSAIARRLPVARRWLDRQDHRTAARTAHRSPPARSGIRPAQEHADLAAKAALQRAIIDAPGGLLSLEISGGFDLVLLIDAPHMAAFNAIMHDVLESSPAIQRYETSFVKRQIKFAPAVALSRQELG